MQTRKLELDPNTLCLCAFMRECVHVVMCHVIGLHFSWNVVGLCRHNREDPLNIYERSQFKDNI